MELIIGSHVSFNKENQLVGCVIQTLEYGANTFMFYTGAPQNTNRLPIDDELTDKALELMKENNIDINNVVVHAPYIINLANKESLEKWHFSINFLKQEVKRCEKLGIKYVVVHPGNSLKTSREEAIVNISEALDLILSDTTKCMILIETMAGKGSECGKSISEIKDIIDFCKEKSKVGVCLDTCHLNDSGYNLLKFDEFLNEFDGAIGIDKIKCVHINDSKNNVGEHKDRHENIGLGTIGFDNIINIIYHEKLKNVPKILETPYIDKEYPPYKFEIEMIKNKTFNENLVNDIKDFYN